jgi:hypothetical protein
MRRSVAAALLAFAALWAPSSAAQTPTRDSVIGTVAVGEPGTAVTLAFDAFSGPSGENPAGTVGSFPATCLSVTGSRAVVAVDSGSSEFFFVVVVDGGATGQDRVGIFPTARPEQCATFAGAADLPVLDGDVIVTDAQPIPTTKEQCKNGGWRNFPGFKNQGDCVSFVATRGKNPPSG